MVIGLASALNWYQKKIGAYDKQSWEKTVDQRILRGVSAIPKKTARIKTELIDVDLVRGSAFPKAKPQHSWIAATSSGVIRVLFMPCFYSWWQQQTNHLVSKVLVLLYFLQLGAMYLYFSSKDAEFPDVPASEILTPAAMMLVLGIVHSQIVATFSTKTSQKHVTRTKRKKVKRKSRMKTPFDYESKSSPETASEEKTYDAEQTYPSSSANDGHKESSLKASISPQSSTMFDVDEVDKHKEVIYCNRSIVSCSSGRSQAHVATSPKPKDSDEESGLDSIDFTQPSEDYPNKQNVESPSVCNIFRDSGCLVQRDEGKNVNDHHLTTEILHNVENEKISKVSSQESFERKTGSFIYNSKCNSNRIGEENVSSGEEYFVAKKPSYNKLEWKKYLWKVSSSSHLSKSFHAVNRCFQFCPRCMKRRFSDVGPQNKVKNNKFLLAEKIDQRYSEDGILSNKRHSCNCVAHNISPQCFVCTGSDEHDLHFSCNSRCDHWCVRNRKFNSSEFQLKNNIKRPCSSCESGADTSPLNSPNKPQTSDLEWPLITNTDCNSDSSDCSSQSSHTNESDISPSENPFAWEMQESPSTLFSGGYTISDKGTHAETVSCTIWEHNECKKVDLTVLDISSAIIRKVDSSIQSTEYLAIGLFFAVIVSFLPLFFRLQTGTAKDVFQDVTSDVLLLTVPSRDEVVRITDVLQEIMLGSNWKVKIVVLIVMIERFTMSLAYFFLLCVAERTFKQRFLYAKHFCHLTSSRRARRSELPHFRLNKVRNIKTWLSVRSYLKKLGPQRSVDVIVSIAFILEVCVLSFLCVQLLKETEPFADRLYCWEMLCWNLAIGLFLLRFMIIGSKINKKYRNLSVLITEQINLYLHMEQKPHKKDELMLANNVLKLAADLLKELESPFKISGLCANPYLYNVTKVVVLSAFSAVLTELLGFKLKLHKIKIK